MHSNRKRPSKKPASLRRYTPQNQLKLGCFEPDPMFARLDKTNRWVVLSDKIPWDDLVNIFYSFHPPHATGRKGLSPRIIIGSVIIKHFYDYDDRETLEQIRENAYLQYFIGLETFMTDPPFDSSLFVEIRHKLTPGLQQRISEKLFGMIEKPLSIDNSEEKKPGDPGDCEVEPGADNEVGGQDAPSHKGELLMPACRRQGCLGSSPGHCLSYRLKLTP